MDRAHFLGFCLLGLAAALAVFFPLGAKRRAWIPPLAWWLCLILGAVLCMYGVSHSVAPSFATRITAVGKAYDYFDHVERGRFGYSYYGFCFVPDGGEPVKRTCGLQNVINEFTLAALAFNITRLHVMRAA